MSSKGGTVLKVSGSAIDLDSRLRLVVATESPEETVEGDRVTRGAVETHVTLQMRMLGLGFRLNLVATVL